MPGQLYKYNLVAPRPRRCVYLFGVRPDKKRLEERVKYFQSQGIEMYSFDKNDEIFCHTAERENSGAQAVKIFVTERMVCHVGSYIEWIELSRTFKDWAQAKNILHAASLKRDDLKLEFAKHGVMYAQPKVGSKTVTRVLGWSFRPKQEQQ